MEERTTDPKPGRPRRGWWLADWGCGPEPVNTYDGRAWRLGVARTIPKAETDKWTWLRRLDVAELRGAAG